MLDWTACGNRRRLGLGLLVCECEGESIGSKLCLASVCSVLLVVCFVNDTERVLLTECGSRANAWGDGWEGGAPRNEVGTSRATPTSLTGLIEGAVRKDAGGCVDGGSSNGG